MRANQTGWKIFPKPRWDDICVDVLSPSMYMCVCVHLIELQGRPLLSTSTTKDSSLFYLPIN